MDEHVHHGPSYRNYIIVFAGLAVLTGLTVGLSYSGLSEGVRMFGAFTIATIKALLVAVIFMHLRYEKRLLAIFAIVPVVLAVFFIAAISPDIGTVSR